MTNKQAQQIVTRLAGDLRALVNVNPDCLKNATIYIHGIPEDQMPRQFKLDTEWANGVYRTYVSEHKDGNFKITAFTYH